MKLFILSIFFLCHLFSFSSCNAAKKKENEITEFNNNPTITITPKEDISGQILIGGQSYSKTRAIKWKYLLLRIDPYKPEEGSVNLEGIETLQTLNSLTIAGNNFDEVDFSPLKALNNLRRLEIGTSNTETGFTRLPDLSGLDALVSLRLANADISSVEGIGKIPHLRNFDLTDVYSGNMKIIDMRELGQLQELVSVILVGGGDINFSLWTGPVSLKKLYIDKDIVACNGIEVLSGLVDLDMQRCNSVINPEALQELKNIETLRLNINNSEQSLEFLSKMTSLRSLSLYADYNNPKVSFFDEEGHNYIRIDAALFKGLENLSDLDLWGFTIENFHLLDELPLLERVKVVNIRFDPEHDNELDIGVFDDFHYDR